MLRRLAVLAATSALAWLSTSAPARAGSIGIINMPLPAYLSSTTLMDVTACPAPPNTRPASGIGGCMSVTSGGLTVNFGAPMFGLKFPNTWGTWNCPPNTETPLAGCNLPKGTKPVASLPLLWSGQYTYGPDPGDGVTGVSPVSSLTMTFGGATVKTFGFEAQPDSSTVDAMTATFYNNATVLGTISLNVSGNGGALLFAATSTTAFTSVKLTDAASDDFALANLRFSSNTIPEPASFLLLGSSLAALGLWKLYRT